MNKFKLLILLLLFVIIPINTKAEIIYAKLPEKTINLEVELTYSIEDVKQKIQDGEGLPPENYILVFNNTELEDTKKLSDYNIMGEMTIEVLSKKINTIIINNLEEPSLNCNLNTGLDIFSEEGDYFKETNYKWFKLNDNIELNYCTTLECLNNNATELHVSSKITENGNYILYISLTTKDNYALSDDYFTDITFDTKTVTVQSNNQKIELIKGYNINEPIINNPPTGDNINIALILLLTSLLSIIILPKKIIK